MPYTVEELYGNEYFQSLVQADEKEYQLKLDSAITKAKISGSAEALEVEGEMQLYEDVRTGSGLDAPHQWIFNRMLFRNHETRNEILDEVIDRDFTLDDKPIIKVKDGSVIKKPNSATLCLYQDDVKYPIANMNLFGMMGFKTEDIITIGKKLYDSIQNGPWITNSRMRNADALLGTHRDADFFVPGFEKMDDDSLAKLRDKLEDGKPIVDSLYQITGQVAKSAQQVRALARQILGEPLQPQPSDLIKQVEQKQYEEEFNKEVAIKRDTEGLTARDRAQRKAIPGESMDDIPRKTSSRPKPTTQTKYSDSNNRGTIDKIGY
jgi:hypothetical protein